MNGTDGQRWKLGKFVVEIVEMKNGFVRYRYINPTPAMSRDSDGEAYGRIAAAAFASQNGGRAK